MKNVGVIVVLILFSLGIYVFWQFIRFNDGKMHVIFCDVGQGDAVLIRTPDSKYILYDGGPDRKVLNCLSDHMPFWQRSIDLMILSHPHADHFYGMFYVLERYQVKSFTTEDLINKTQAYDELLNQIEDRNIAARFVSAGDQWNVGDVHVQVAGPTEKYLRSTSPGGTIGESKEFASLIMQVSYGNFDLLLTGDSQASGLQDASEQLSDAIEVLQSPHHGSATGLDNEILSILYPELAVISVGENRYGHPTKKILDLFEQFSVKVLRTDEKGSVEILTNGHKWELRQAIDIL